MLQLLLKKTIIDSFLGYAKQKMKRTKNADLNEKKQKNILKKKTLHLLPFYNNE